MEGSGRFVALFDVPGYKAKLNAFYEDLRDVVQVRNINLRVSKYPHPWRSAGDSLSRLRVSKQ